MNAGEFERDVTQVCFDYGVVLNFSDGGQLRVDAGFTIESPEGKWIFGPGGADGAERIVGLLHRQVKRTIVDDLGRIEMTLSGECVIKCREDPDFEAWTLTSADGELHVSLPGGGLGHWPRGH